MLVGLYSVVLVGLHSVVLVGLCLVVLRVCLWLFVCSPWGQCPFAFCCGVWLSEAPVLKLLVARGQQRTSRHQVGQSGSGL